MNWTVGLLSIAARVLGVRLDRRRVRERGRLPRADLRRWEENRWDAKGGAVPDVSRARTAAQTEAPPARESM